jgi:hypothetical protein
MARQHEQVLTSFDQLRVNRIEITLAEGKTMDGIKNIGLARAIVSQEKVDTITEFPFSFGVVLELLYIKAFEVHR